MYHHFPLLSLQLLLLALLIRQVASGLKSMRNIRPSQPIGQAVPGKTTTILAIHTEKTYGQTWRDWNGRRNADGEMRMFLTRRERLSAVDTATSRKQANGKSVAICSDTPMPPNTATKLDNETLAEMVWSLTHSPLPCHRQPSQAIILAGDYSDPTPTCRNQASSHPDMMFSPNATHRPSSILTFNLDPYRCTHRMHGRRRRVEAGVCPRIRTLFEDKDRWAYASVSLKT